MPKIRFFGSLRKVLGTNEIDIDIPDECIAVTEFVKMMASRFKEIERIFPDASIPPYILVFIDGVEVRVFDSLDEAKVCRESTVDVVPVIHGG